MKYSKLVLIILIISTLISCQNTSNKTDAEDSISVNDSFYSLIENNPIDQYYEKEIKNGVKSISEIVNTYTSLWIEEFDNTVSKCDNILTEEQAQEIVSLLSKWKNNEKSLWEWQMNEIFENKSYAYGTQVYCDEWKSVGDRFREKTIWLKYQLYIVEISNNPEKSLNELDSVMFSNNQGTVSVKTEETER